MTISAATWQSIHLPTLALAAASQGEGLSDIVLCVNRT